MCVSINKKWKENMGSFSIALFTILTLLIRPTIESQSEIVLETIPHLHKFWELSFHIEVRGVSSSWTTLLQATDAENKHIYGLRIPGVYLKPSKFWNQFFHLVIFFES